MVGNLVCTYTPNLSLKSIGSLRVYANSRKGMFWPFRNQNSISLMQFHWDSHCSDFSIAITATCSTNLNQIWFWFELWSFSFSKVTCNVKIFFCKWSSANLATTNCTYIQIWEREKLPSGFVTTSLLFWRRQKFCEKQEDLISDVWRLFLSSVWLGKNSLVIWALLSTKNKWISEYEQSEFNSKKIWRNWISPISPALNSRLHSNSFIWTPAWSKPNK